MNLFVSCLRSRPAPGIARVSVWAALACLSAAPVQADEVKSTEEMEKILLNGTQESAAAEATDKSGGPSGVQGDGGSRTKRRAVPRFPSRGSPQETADDIVADKEEKGKPDPAAGSSHEKVEVRTNAKIFRFRGPALAGPSVDAEAPYQVAEIEAEASEEGDDESGDLLVSYTRDRRSQLPGVVLFEQGQSEILLDDPATREFLTRLRQILGTERMRKRHFVVEGHASAEGERLANKLLSQRRADAVVEFLTSSAAADADVGPSQLLAIGHGEDRAVAAATAPEEERARDRRVLIYRLEETKQ